MSRNGVRRTGTGASDMRSSGGPGSSRFQTTRPTGTYIASLDKLSQTPSQPDLYSKIQYQNLSRFLSRTPALSHGEPVVNPNPATGSPNNDHFTHVVVHTLSHGTIAKAREDYELKDVIQFINEPQPSDPNTDQVVFVRGSLSPAWIDALGTKYKIDPEFFRRHLRYLGGQDYHDLPSLPSANTDIMTLMLPSLYTRNHNVTPAQVMEWREKDDAEVAKRNQIAVQSLGGETVIRRFSTLSQQLFSVEHEISIFKRSRKNGGRIAVVLLDNGLDMNRDNGPPCCTRQDSIMSPGGGSSVAGISPIPVIVPRPPTISISSGSRPKLPDDHSCPPARNKNSITHVASLLPFYPIGTPTLTTMHNSTYHPPDIFFSICDLFRLVAGSECQFLNQLRRLVQDQNLDPRNSEKLNLAMDTLQHIKALAEHHKQSLKENISFLKTRCCNSSPPLLDHYQPAVDAGGNGPTTSASALPTSTSSAASFMTTTATPTSPVPRRPQPVPLIPSQPVSHSQPQSQSYPPNYSSHNPNLDDSLSTIVTDLTELLARAEALTCLCADTTALLLNGAMLWESEKAIRRADDQRRLTVLAYLFLPLSLVFSLFGMNVSELGQGTQSIYWPFGVLVPVGLISWMLFFPRKVKAGWVWFGAVLRRLLGGLFRGLEQAGFMLLRGGGWRDTGKKGPSSSPDGTPLGEMNAPGVGNVYDNNISHNSNYNRDLSAEEAGLSTVEN